MVVLTEGTGRSLLDSLNDLTATEMAAWWGAIVASLVLAWDFYKWKTSGARIRLTASPNMRTFDSPNRYIIVTAVNVGDLPTTLTAFGGSHYKTHCWGFIRTQQQDYVFPNPTIGPGVPHVLKPGERWMGNIDQEEMEKKGEAGALYCMIMHSGSKRPVWAKVKLKKGGKP